MSDDSDDLDEWMIGPPDGKKPKPKGERRKKVRRASRDSAQEPAPDSRTSKT